MKFNIPTVALRTNVTEEICKDSVLYADKNAEEFSIKINELVSSKQLVENLNNKQQSRIEVFESPSIYKKFTKLVENLFFPKY